MNAKKTRVGIIFLIGIIFIPLIFADGCCFDPENGYCSDNSDAGNCVQKNGVYSENLLCTYIDECEKGCCVLGAKIMYETYTTCQKLSAEKGIDITESFQYISKEQCSDMINPEDGGACVYEGENDKTCKYTSKAQCSGDFYSEVFCSHPELNTICNKTEKTMCYNKDVHFIDSCENPDAVKEKCDGSSKVCYAEKEKNAYCKNLNCGENRTNGEKWCVDTTPSQVGSRYFRQYCSDGEIVTEACSDYRAESCEKGDCKLNPWADCLSANPSEAEGEVDTEACDSEYCEIFEAEAEESTYGYNGKSYTKKDSSGKDVAVSASSLSKEQKQKAGRDGLIEEIFEAIPIGFCISKIPGGLKFFSSDSAESSLASDDEEVCDLGNYEKKVSFVKTKGKSSSQGVSFTGVQGGTGKITMPKISLKVINAFVEKFSGKSLISGDLSLGPGIESMEAEETAYWYCTAETAKGWKYYPCSLFEGVNRNDFGANGGKTKEESNTAKIIKQIAEGKASSLKVKEEVVMALTERCQTLGDCDGKYNWVEGIGEFEPTEAGEVSKKQARAIDITFSFECLPFTPPVGGEDCEKCGADGLPCSEYRCKALGSECKYSNPNGVKSGFCLKSGDKTAPQITNIIQIPSGKIPPYESVQINISTNEVSECKFGINEVESSYENMSFKFGDSWNTNHSIKLNVPGQKSEEDLEEYDILEEGIIKIYIGCQDRSGNSNPNIYVLSIEVMPTPDKIPPTIVEDSFIPADGSAVKYETTSKGIEFKIKEPSECKWDLTDKSYERMNYKFECDTESTKSTIVKGYKCSGILENISTIKNSKTDFYIRCKDQPELEGKEDDIYKRNTNEESVKYSLRPSEKFEILEISPEGQVTKTKTDNKINLKVITIGGGSFGKSLCKWKLSGICVENRNNAFVLFEGAETSIHTKEISEIKEGECRIDAKCEDSSGNSVEGFSEINVKVDESAPEVVRSYSSGNELVVITNEDAVCKYTNEDKINCRFDFDSEEVFEMTGSKKSHSANSETNKKYYIKCKDYYNNVNSGCGIIVRV